jgi:hypothetical protein
MSFFKSQIQKRQLRKMICVIFLSFLFTLFLWDLIFRLGENGVFGNWEFIKAIFYFETGMLVAIICYKLEKRINSYWERRSGEGDNGERGREGEKAALSELKSVLSDEYKIYKNFKIPGRKFDIDFVIVGPKGLIVFEVKNYSGKMVFYQEYALKKLSEANRQKDEVHLFGKNDPRNQIIYHSAIFDQYLADLGFENLKINKALVFVNDMVEMKGKSGIPIISGLDKLRVFLIGLEEDEKFTSEFCGRINKAFENAWRG